MKLLHINASYKPAYIYGGPALSVSRLCEGLVQSGVELEVLTTTANGAKELNIPLNEVQVIDGVPVTYFKRLTKDHTHFSPALLSALNKTLKKERETTIVHIHVWWNLVSVLSCFIARQRKAIVVLTPRGTLSNYSFGNRNAGIKNYIHRFLGKSLLEYCHFHVTSEKEKEDLLKLVKPRSVTVIPNFVYLPEKANEEPISKKQNDAEKIKLLFLSRIEEKKGLDILFTALSEFKVPYHLTIAGTGEESYMNFLKDLAKSLNITSSVTWIGQQSQQEKWGVMEQHDLMVLPSHDENFGNVVIECLSTGTPVLISNKVGLADYVKRRDFGWICSVDKDSIINNLLLFSQQVDKSMRIHQLAPQQIRNDFDEEVLVQEFLKMYSSILDFK
ncbi:MAG: glycosyltransferase [Pyrinomonadaceae bacterium]|nr:glycosyltransferase [Sphingobacteriaceae bacterium]